MSFINVEIKARCENTVRIEKVLLEKQAKYIGTDHQVDTYFKVPNGRLKIREGDIENALIFYQRSDQAGPKKAEITMYTTENIASLKAVMEKVHEILVVVDKRRKIYFLENVKFHLDEVKGLGQFMEIEAIDQHRQLGEKKLRQQVDDFLQLFDIQKADLLHTSYSNMLMENQSRRFSMS
jgi:adenylate cyclase, class 2